MPISVDTHRRLASGLASVGAADELVAAIDAGSGGSGSGGSGEGGTGATPPDYDATEHYVTAADTGTHNILGDSPVPRVVIVVVTITESYTAGDGAEPTLEIGEAGAPSKFATADRFAGAIAGTTVVCAGLLSAGADLIATGVAGTGTATGAATVDAMTVGVGHVDAAAAAADAQRRATRATSAQQQPRRRPR